MLPVLCGGVMWPETDSFRILAGGVYWTAIVVCAFFLTEGVYLILQDFFGETDD